MLSINSDSSPSSSFIVEKSLSKLSSVSSSPFISEPSGVFIFTLSQSKTGFAETEISYSPSKSTFFKTAQLSGIPSSRGRISFTSKSSESVLG